MTRYTTRSLVTAFANLFPSTEAIKFEGEAAALSISGGIVYSYRLPIARIVSRDPQPRLMVLNRKDAKMPNGQRSATTVQHIGLILGVFAVAGKAAVEVNEGVEIIRKAVPTMDPSGNYGAADTSSDYTD